MSLKVRLPPSLGIWLNLAEFLGRDPTSIDTTCHAAFFCCPSALLKLHLQKIKHIRLSVEPAFLQHNLGMGKRRQSALKTEVTEGALCSFRGVTRCLSSTQSRGNGE